MGVEGRHLHVSSVQAMLYVKLWIPDSVRLQVFESPSWEPVVGVEGWTECSSFFNISQAWQWWCMLLIPALMRQRQENLEFMANRAMPPSNPNTNRFHGDRDDV